MESLRHMLGAGPKQAWDEQSMPSAPTMLSAPTGGVIQSRRESIAPAAGGERNMGSMWSRVQDLTRKLEEAETETATLKGQLTAAQAEVGFVQARLTDAESKAEARASELKASQAEGQQLQLKVRSLQEEVAGHVRRQEEEAAAKAALEAKNGPAPPPPEEVRAELLQAFDGAAATVCAELAEKAGVEAGAAEEAEGEEGGFTVGASGFDSAAMEEAGLSVPEMAEQYLRSAMERAVTAVEPARVAAVTKWRSELTQRRSLQDQLQELKGSIRVMCRVRPPSASEIAAGGVAVSTTSETEVLLQEGSGKGSKKSFAFDHVFGSGCEQAGVFEEVEPVLDSVLAGFNVCIFAYGQTGSGKTFTMDGVRDDPNLSGINPRSLRRIFELIADKRQLAKLGGKSNDDGWQYEVSVSYVEIYNENLRDLLGSQPGGDKKAASLSIQSIQGQQVHVPGLTSVAVCDIDEVDAALAKGAGRRAVGSTKCNATSSRSHSIVMVTVTGKHATTGASTHGKLHLVDLAGSERVKKSEVSGQGMTEAQNINKSLSALGDVMSSLQEKSKHIPFRNSKLTQLLADSLGGNSKTFMFVNVNPALAAAPETLCSLNFASRVRRVELGKGATARVQAGASVADVKLAEAAKDKALNELAGANARLHELEREASLAREAQAGVEAELAAERKAASGQRATRASKQGAEAEKAALELAEERKRNAALEAQLKEGASKLAAAEKRASAKPAVASRAAAEPPAALAEPPAPAAPAAFAAPAAAPAPPAAPPAREFTRQTRRSVAAAAAPSAPPPAPAAPAAPSAAPTFDLLGGLMDAPVTLDTSAAPLFAAPSSAPYAGLSAGLSAATTAMLQPTTSMLQPMGTQPAAPARPATAPAAPAPAAAEPSSGEKRRSPRLAESWASSRADAPPTPTRWTPAKLARGDAASDKADALVRSGRKVQFKFPAPSAPQPAFEDLLDDDEAAESEKGDSFPVFAGFAAGIDGENKPPSERSFANSFGGGAKGPQSALKVAQPLKPAGPQSLSGPQSLNLGGAARVVVNSSRPKRSAAQRQTMDGGLGGIAKSSGRRMSLAAQAAVESSNRLNRRPAWA